jgi:hypothetical protein
MNDGILEEGTSERLYDSHFQLLDSLGKTGNNHYNPNYPDEPTEVKMGILERLGIFAADSPSFETPGLPRQSILFSEKSP